MIGYILSAVRFTCQTYLQNKERERSYCLDKDKKHLIINLVKLLEIYQDVIVKI